MDNLLIPMIFIFIVFASFIFMMQKEQIEQLERDKLYWMKEAKYMENLFQNSIGIDEKLKLKDT